VVSAFDAEGRLGRRTAFASVTQRAVGPGEPEWLGARRDGMTADRTYRYGLDGELLEAADAQRGSTTYAYDPVGRLEAMVPPQARPHVFRHDAAGNLFEGEGGAARKYARGRLVESGATTYRWDDEGRLVEKRTEKDGGAAAWTYGWNAAGLLTHVEGPSGEVVDFAYDPLARRVEKRVSRRPGPGERPVPLGRTRFVWDGNVLVHEIRETARRGGDPIVEERTYCFEDLSFEPALQRVARKGDDSNDTGTSSGWLSYMNDPAGAPDRLIASDGSVACEIERGAWGRGRTASGSTAETPFGLQGQYEDPETGLAYNRFRYYDADAGRFISPDPVGLAGGVHPYTYALNIQGWVDPLGLAPGDPVLLGQTMGSRVTPTANANGWHTFQTNSSFKPGDPGAEEAWMKNQKRWMRDQVDSGRRIYDIGDDPTRADRSKYCAMEHQVLKEEGFTRVCTGKSMMVNGVDTPLHEWVPPAGWKPGDGKKRRMGTL
jgi:RHS repeat-associated protein